MARMFVRPQLLVLLLTVCVVAVSAGGYYRMSNHVLAVTAHPASGLYIFPDGGRQLFPRYRLIALYGTPGTPALGALGEQDAEASMRRAKALAADYQPFMRERALPAVEIIATVASSMPTGNGDYSYPVDTALLQQWINAARRDGVYVVLDLQSGRNSFLAQAHQLQPLLAQPNVGLALDPEWRLGPTELPLVQIGSVGIGEVNQTAGWLAEITKTHHLPQKLFLLHEFRPAMLPGREQLDVAHPELAYAIQMDGQGTQAAKFDTWQAILAAPPAGVHFGWKNFYHKDEPIRSPADTMALTPQPWYISYQ